MNLPEFVQLGIGIEEDTDRFVEWKKRCGEEFWKWDQERSKEIMDEVWNSIGERLRSVITSDE